MNVVIKVFVASLDLVLLNILLALPVVFNPLDAVWYSLCIALGFVLRIAILIKDDKYSHKALLLHMVFTICWCFLAVLAWNTWFYSTWINQGKSFEIYLFFNSLSAVFLVGEFDYMSKTGIKGWLRIKLGKFLAKDEGGTPL